MNVSFVIRDLVDWCIYLFIFTMKSLELSRIHCSDRFGHSGRSADATRINSTHAEVIGVTLEQAGHGVFTDLNGRLITLYPVVCSDLTSVTEFRQRA